jgi:hypothetical protein
VPHADDRVGRDALERQTHHPVPAPAVLVHQGGGVLGATESWAPTILPRMKRSRDVHQLVERLPPGDAPSVAEVINHQAKLLLAHPDLVASLAWAQRDGELDEASAREAMAREHRFASYADALAADRRVDPRFEAACDAIVDGEIDALRAIVDRDLVRARSAYRHQSTLLHHVAANGIESGRQWQSPANAPAIAELLLAAGAEPDATCRCYGPADTTLELLVSSSHPAAAGVQADVVEVLVRGGARVDGLEDDGAPIWTAITSGYATAVDRLVACGARIDNLVLAAASGDVARVKEFLGRPCGARFGRHVFEPERMVDYATIYAAMLGRRVVVELLLTEGPDLTIVEPVHRSTALGAARYPHPAAGRPNGSPDIAALIEAARGS